MLYWFARIICKLSGWTFINRLSHLKKYVVIAAPHTSNWDGIWGLSFIAYHRLPFKFLIKKDLFFFPLGPILKSLGGLPVDRNKNTSLVDQCVGYFQHKDALVLGVTPEGTRSYNPNWKKGFYYISEKAGVPLVVSYIDYAKKTVCIDHVFEKSGDIDRDIERLKAFYKDKVGKHPEKGVK